MTPCGISNGETFGIDALLYWKLKSQMKARYLCAFYGLCSKTILFDEVLKLEVTQNSKRVMENVLWTLGGRGQRLGR